MLIFVLRKELMKKKNKKKTKRLSPWDKVKQIKKRFKLVTLALIISIIANLSLGIYQHNQLVGREREINEKQQEIDLVNEQINELNEKLKAGEIKENEYEEKIKNLEKEKEELNEKLQARINSRASNNAYAASGTTYTVQGTCSEWIKQAGISDVANAYTLIMHESGCNVNSVNKSSGACGIPQALPCSKLGSARGNPVAEIRWMNNYVINRYGSWANAVAFWNTHKWY